MARSLPVIINFEEPIDSGIKGPENKPVIYDKLVINRKPTGNEYRAFPITNPTFDDYQRVASKVTNVPLHVIRKMSGPKTMELVEAFSDFLLE